MTDPWVVGLALAVAIAGGYAIWRVVAVIRFRRATTSGSRDEAAGADTRSGGWGWGSGEGRAGGKSRAEAVTADRLIKRAEAAVARLKEQTDSPRDPILRAQIGDVDDHAAEVLQDLRRFAEQVKTLERSLHGIPVDRLNGELAQARRERDAAGDAGLRSELERSVHALEQQLAVAERLDTTRRTLLARIEAAVFDLEGLGVRVTELIVMHDAAGAADTSARLSELTGDLEGMRAGLAEARGLSDSVLGTEEPSKAPVVPPKPKRQRKPSAPVDQPVPDKPAPDKPAPDKPAPDKPAPDKPVPGRRVPEKPGRARWDIVAVAVVVVLAGTCLAADFLPHRSSGGPDLATTADPNTNECPQTLAFMGELTGDNAGDGPGELDAVQLAAAQDNAAHANACQVRVQQYDTAITGDVAKTAGVIVADPSIMAVVGPTYGSEAGQAMPVFQPVGLAAISPSASDSDLTTKGWTVFHRTLPSDDDQADAGARYLRDPLKVHKVFVVGDDTAFGKDVSARVIQQLGSLVVGHAAVAENDADFSPVVDQVRQRGADAVYFGGHSDDTASFVQAVKAALPKITVMSGDRIITETFRKSAGDAGHGTYATCPCLPVTQGLDVFRSQFKARFGDTPEYYSPEAYDAAKIVLAGLRAGKTTRAGMLQFVGAWDGDGLGRHIKFAANGGLAGPGLNVWAYQSGSDGYFVAQAAIG